MAGVPLLLWKLLEEIRPGEQVLIARMDRPAGPALKSRSVVGTARRRVRRRGLDRRESAPASTTSTTSTSIDVLGPTTTSSVVPVTSTSRTIASGSELFELDIHNLAALRRSPLAELIGAQRRQVGSRDASGRGSGEFKRAFLQSLFDGDGSSSMLPRNTIQISYSTYSEQLANDVQLLLLEFGVVAVSAVIAKGELKVVDLESPRRAPVRPAGRLPRRRSSEARARSRARSRQSEPRDEPRPRPVRRRLHPLRERFALDRP